MAIRVITINRGKIHKQKRAYDYPHDYVKNSHWIENDQNWITNFLTNPNDNYSDAKEYISPYSEGILILDNDKKRIWYFKPEMESLSQMDECSIPENIIKDMWEKGYLNLAIIYGEEDEKVKYQQGSGMSFEEVMEMINTTNDSDELDFEIRFNIDWKKLKWDFKEYTDYKTMYKDVKHNYKLTDVELEQWQGFF